ncbi:DNA recombination protein RmuC, partial [Rhodobacteraceae bacterium 4F10]
MNTTLLLILIAISTLLIGFVIGNLLSKLKFKQQTSDLEKEIVTLQNHQANFEIQKKEKEESFSQQKEDFLNRLDEKTKENSELRREKEFTALELARKNEELKNVQLKLQENKEEVEKLQDKFTKEFENLANKILDEKSNKFTEQNKKNIKDILNPLQEKIQTFEKKVEDTQKESISMHSALKEQLLGLKELNAQMSKETLNLTKALKGDSKTQGNWGELVLERVLEKSGLEKDREYFVQQSFTNDEGKRIMPDVVIHLPDNKKMVVDSKV